MQGQPSALLAVLFLFGCATVESTSADGIGILTRDHRILADGHELAMWEKRSMNPKRAILLIHGRTWSGKPDFDLQVEGEELSLMAALAGMGYATYALDLRGYGGTDRDSSGFTTPDRSAADVAVALAWLRDHSGIPGRPVLFGWSFGAMVAQLTAQRHPELLSELILYGHPYDPEWSFPESPGSERRPEYRINTAEAARSDFITPGSISAHAIHNYVEASLVADPVRSDWQHLEQFNALDPSLVSMPTLIIRGQFDPIAKLDAQAKLLKALPNSDCQLLSIAGGDHAIHLERPRAFVRNLQGFLNRPRSRTRSARD